MRTAFIFLLTTTMGLTACHRNPSHVTVPCSCAHARHEQATPLARNSGSASHSRNQAHEYAGGVRQPIHFAHSRRSSERRREREWDESTASSEDSGWSDERGESERTVEGAQMSHDSDWIDGFGRKRVQVVVDTTDARSNDRRQGDEIARLDPWSGYDRRCPENGY
jgi:hypothetical protein